MSILIHLKSLALLTATTGKTLFSRILVECLHTILYLVNNRRSALLQPKTPGRPKHHRETGETLKTTLQFWHRLTKVFEFAWIWRIFHQWEWMNVKTTTKLSRSFLYVIILPFCSQILKGWAHHWDKESFLSKLIFCRKILKSKF